MYVYSGNITTYMKFYMFKSMYVCFSYIKLPGHANYSSNIHIVVWNEKCSKYEKNFNIFIGYPIMLFL